MLRLARRHRWKLLIAALLLPPLWVVGDVFVEDDNFRVVTADLYRAGQLRSDEWAETFSEHPYRSVVNLRGENQRRDWYRTERAFSEEHGIPHYDFGLSDGTEPSLETMRRLVALMREAPKPLLVHCQAGADRSGLAAALYLYAVEGRPAGEASGQLSLWYGHFPWIINRTGAMDRAFAHFAAADG